MHRTVERMLRTNPEPPFAPPDTLGALIHACIETAQVCTACADAALGEHRPGVLATCIRLNLDCADVVTMTSRLLSRQTNPDLALVAMAIELCAVACDVCARECDRHANDYAHCHVAAVACRDCFEACRALMRGTPPSQLPH